MSWIGFPYLKITLIEHMIKSLIFLKLLIIKSANKYKIAKDADRYEKMATNEIIKVPKREVLKFLKILIEINEIIKIEATYKNGGKLLLSENKKPKKRKNMGSDKILIFTNKYKSNNEATNNFN